MQLHFFDSAHQAQAILGALQTGDAERLRQELERVKRLNPHTPDAAESERIELLSEIARELRTAGKATEYGSEVYCGLLEHLAGAGNRRRRAATAFSAAAPQAKPAALFLQ
jgi:hypothetical protein